MEPSHMAHQLHIENLYRKFADEKHRVLRPVLDNVDLRVSPGEFVCVVGPSGCGKSTLLRICLGADHGYEGRVDIEGKPVQFPDSTRGLVPQKYGIYPHLTVLQNVSIGLELKHPLWYRLMHRRTLLAQAREFLEVVDLSQHASKFPYQLSGGQQQRVSIAQTLITRPSIVFMDEPFSALDTSTRERVQLFLLQLWENYKMTVIFVTHDINEAVILGTRLVLLSQYYKDDRGDLDDSGTPVLRGAKVVRDLPLSLDVLPMKTKGEPGFAAFVRNITEGPGFKPDHREHVRQFDLLHPNSFSSLTLEEDRTGVGRGCLTGLPEGVMQGKSKQVLD